nr:unnamed protein product [Digitaria exilis]
MGEESMQVERQPHGIGYCLVDSSFVIKGLVLNWVPKYKHQMRCDFWCSQNQWITPKQQKPFGFFLFDDVPLLFLLVLVVIAEVRSVKIPEEVKAYIIRTLRRYHSNGQQLNNSIESLRRKGVGEMFLRACSSNSISDTILTWHIATCILEVRYPYQHGFRPGLDHKITATHLSRYCTYLMVWSPELLPDDEEGTKSLYETIKEDVKCALAGFTAAVGSLTPEAEYEQVIRFLNAKSNHAVTRNGVMLGRQLVELIEGEDTPWAVLAEFWVDMLLYIAPSDNVRGHLEAIARGGELITLLWALLTHAGIMSRPGDAAATDAGVV